MKTFKEFEESYGRRHDAYTRDYHSSISGMGKHQSHAYHADGGANDEGWDREHHHKPADHPHSVHINGKKWKTFGSHSHATNVARKIKGATVHKEEVQLDELKDTTLMSYAQKVHDDSMKHDKDPSKRSAEKRNKSVMGFSRAINKLEARPHKEEVEQIEELSSDLLARYKEKAGIAATAADKAKKYDLGHKRFKGIMKATFKQFANDAKK